MCVAAMGTVAPPLAFLLLLLQLADGSFPEEPSPLSYVPVEGMFPSCCVCVCVCVCAALMNDSAVDVEIGGQGPEPWCGAALKATQAIQTNSKRLRSVPQWQRRRLLNMREKDMETERREEGERNDGL